jgi:predicted permease
MQWMRSFWRNPGSTTLVVMSLAAGIGLTAALTSVADAILFRPLPVPHPEKIVRIFTSSAEQPWGLVSFRDFEDYRRGSRTVVSVAAQTQVLVAIGGENGAPATIRLGLAVSADYFGALQVTAALGRTFRAQEWHDPVVVLSDAFWRSEFLADQRMVGRAIRLGGAQFTVIGVARKDFGLDRFVHEAFYVPMGVYESGILATNGHPMEDRGRRFLTVYGRLASGGASAAIDAARAEFGVLSARLEAANPETNRGRRAMVVTELEARRNTDRTLPALAAVLIALAAVILTIAASNAGGVLLSRAEARAKEIAVRVALGATPGRLLTASVCEAGLMALAGASLGVPMAWAATRLVTRLATLPTDFPFAIAPRMDARAILVAVAASAIAAIVSGCAPALAARRVDIPAVLKWRGHRHGRAWRNVLVAVEVGLASALVAAGASLFESVKGVNRIDPGYRVEHVLTLALDPGQAGYTRARTRTFYDQLLGRVRSLAGVKSAALAQSVVLGYTRTPAQVSFDEGGVENAATNGAAPARASTAMWMNTITPEYFALMRLPLIAGRAFNDGDTETSPAVAIINQELAKRVVESSGGAIGARIRVNGRMVRVVGVAHGAKYFEIQEAPQPFLYLPYSQNFASRMVLHVETSTGISGVSEGDAHAVLTAVLHEIHTMDAAQPVSEIRPLRDYLDRGAMLGARVGVGAIGVVGASALALAVVGIWGLMGHVIAQRRREIGIRMALGATHRSVIGMVMRQAVVIVVTGALGGLGAAACATRFLAAMAAGTGGIGAWSGGGAAAVAMAGLGAALIPAWRAATVDPVRALRNE